MPAARNRDIDAAGRLPMRSRRNPGGAIDSIDRRRHKLPSGVAAAAK
jgi:hypothetical protein